MNEDPYRHPGGRTRAGAMAILTVMMAGGTGAILGALWAVIR